MDPEHPLVTLACLLWAAAVIAGLVRYNALRSCAFMYAPQRRGTLNMADVLMSFGLWLIVPGVLVMAFHERLPSEGIGRNAYEAALFYTGMLPMAGYILWRARESIQGSLSGLGLNFTAGVRSLWMGPLSLLCLLPLVALTSTAVAWILTSLGHEQPLIGHETLTVLIQSRGQPDWWLLVLLVVLAAPFFEELLFRGLLQTALQQSGMVRDRWVVIACTAFFFAGIHLGSVEVSALPQLYVLGLGLGWIYERWGNLWAVIVAHALFNASNIALAMNVQL